MPFLRRLPPLFYLGLLPLVVLLWAWADSNISWTAWRQCRGQDRERAIAVQGSVLILLQNSQEMNASSPSAMIPLMETGPFGEVRRMRSLEKRTWFPAVDRQVAKQESPYGTITWDRLILPFWLIVLCYLPPWLALAWWQARRRKKKRSAE